MKRTRRFPVLLSQREREVLEDLANAAHTSAAAVVRRLIWRRAEELGLETEASCTKEGATPSEAKNGSE